MRREGNGTTNPLIVHEGLQTAAKRYFIQSLVFPEALSKLVAVYEYEMAKEQATGGDEGRAIEAGSSDSQTAQNGQKLASLEETVSGFVEKYCQSVYSLQVKLFAGLVSSLITQLRSTKHEKQKLINKLKDDYTSFAAFYKTIETDTLSQKDSSRLRGLRDFTALYDFHISSAFSRDLHLLKSEQIGSPQLGNLSGTLQNAPIAPNSPNLENYNSQNNQEQEEEYTFSFPSYHFTESYQMSISSENGFYQGGYLNSGRHGLGKMSYRNGDSYQGEWDHDQRHGLGDFWSGDGAFSYKGSWVDDQFEGRGVLRLQNGDVYRGEFLNGSKQGSGSLTHYKRANKAVPHYVYTGEWEDDMKHGKGKVEYTSGDRYEGEWRLDKKHGVGKFTYKTGDFYEGEWAQGKKCGSGRFVGVNGDSYTGDYLEGKRHGSGKQIYKNGVYEGDFYNDMKHGKGKYVWSDGYHYEGDWFENKRNGHGKETYSNGNQYVGGWKNDRRHGKGKFVGRKGGVFEGEFCEGKRHGFGVMTYKSGKVEEGLWEDNAYKGQMVVDGFEGEERVSVSERIRLSEIYLETSGKKSKKSR